MIHSHRFTCVLDTNVLVPKVTRVILFWFAHHELYVPKWSHTYSMSGRLLRRNVADADITKRKAAASSAFLDALVYNYEELIEGIDLPDSKDRHVMAAAIKTNANLIVTNNLKDFPDEYLATYDLVAQGVDDFLTDTIDLNNKTAKQAFLDMVLQRNNSPMDAYQVLTTLRNIGLAKTANYLHALFYNELRLLLCGLFSI